jgi:hypothetical protein
MERKKGGERGRGEGRKKREVHVTSYFIEKRNEI